VLGAVVLDGAVVAGAPSLNNPAAEVGAGALVPGAELAAPPPRVGNREDVGAGDEACGFASPAKRPAPLAAGAVVVDGAACEPGVLAAGVVPGKLNGDLAGSVAGAAAELVGADVGVPPKILPAAAGFGANSDGLGVDVPENNEPVFGAVEAPVPNKPPAGLAAWPLSAGGGPAGVVEKLNDGFDVAGVVDPAGADVAAFVEAVPKLRPGLVGFERFAIENGLFSVFAGAPAASGFCPKLSALPKEGLDTFVAPKRPPAEPEELVAVVALPPNRPPP
jgi:hypothetical protein